MTVITRFAPSPTGYLHIGGARTALFNYIYAEKMGGKFLLRIEDTDSIRSTKEAVDAIINGLDFLGIEHDGDIVFQKQRELHHKKIAEELVAKNLAYYCYCSKEELEIKRQKAEKNGKVYTYEGKCRNLLHDAHDKTKTNSPVIRIKSSQSGLTILTDLVMGEIKVENKLMDDLIILRSDGTPTYMFAVVIDDIDMGITHVIRGDDHLTNTFRQIQIYNALDAKIPFFAHLPLIHGDDGSKMSKRHGATSVEEYKYMGFLPEAIKSYLLKLGWSYGDFDIISVNDAIKWFDICDVNKSPARFDIKKLTSINHFYIKQTANDKLIALMQELISYFKMDYLIDNTVYSWLLSSLTQIKERGKTILELIEKSSFYMVKNLKYNYNIENLNLEYLIEQKNILMQFENNDFSKDKLLDLFKQKISEKNIKLADYVLPLRLALTGETVCACSVFEIMENFKKDITISKIDGIILYKSQNTSTGC